MYVQAAKTAKGELARYWESRQLLEAIKIKCTTYRQCSHTPSHSNDQVHKGFANIPVILTGDLNATPDTVSGSEVGYYEVGNKYESQAYPFIKRHSLGFRSVMNDDMSGVSTGGEVTSQDVWTSWKTRWKGAEEVSVKQCIDYIMYSPGICSKDGAEEGDTFNNDASIIRSLNSVAPTIGIHAVAALEIPRDDSIGPERLPSAQHPSDHISLVADLQLLSEKD